VISWHEPYFIWEYYLKLQADDYLDESHADEKSVRFIRKQFDYLKKKSGKHTVLEKTPTNAFKIKYINKVLPEAKWIHLYRDGRDVISSMKVQYQRRREIARKRSLRKILADIHYTLSRQPCFRFRLLAILYELRHWHRIAPYFQFSKNRQWSTSIGWGPRYPGWQKDKPVMEEIEFLATQWVRAEQQILMDLRVISPDNLYQFAYEQLLENPISILTQLCEFLGVSTGIVNQLASQVRSNNTQKWKTALSQDEISKIQPIIKSIQDYYNYS
jgi:hypothetical protein